MTKREWEQAYSAGRFARQAARGRNTCPMYGINREDETLRERWRQGWDDEDHARRMQARPTGGAGGR